MIRIVALILAVWIALDVLFVWGWIRLHRHDRDPEEWIGS